MIFLHLEELYCFKLREGKLRTEESRWRERGGGRGVTNCCSLLSEAEGKF